MSTSPAIELAETAIAKLCHDLSSSLGAVMNALELAGGGDELGIEALQLAQEASRDLAARLRLSRSLWAAADGASKAELVGLLSGLPNAGRLVLDTAELADAAIPGPVKQLVLAVMLVAADSLRGAGRIVLAGDPASDMLVVLHGKRAAWPDGFAAAIMGPTPDWGSIGPRALMPFLIGMLARAAGARVSLLLSTGASDTPPPVLISLPPALGHAASPVPADS